MNKGWKNESARHSLAARGMKTKCKAPSKHLDISGYGEVISATQDEWFGQRHRLIMKVNEEVDAAYREHNEALIHGSGKDSLQRHKLFGKYVGLDKGRDMLEIYLPHSSEDADNKEWKRRVRNLGGALQLEYEHAGHAYENALYGEDKDQSEIRMLEGRRNGISRVKDLVTHYMQQWSR